MKLLQNSHDLKFVVDFRSNTFFIPSVKSKIHGINVTDTDLRMFIWPHKNIHRLLLNGRNSLMYFSYANICPVYFGLKFNIIMSNNESF